MIQRLLLASLLACFLCSASNADAQKRGKSKAKPAPAPTAAESVGGGGTTTVYAKQTNYDFDDDLVNGDLVRPDGEQLVVRRRGERRSLVRLREHFIPEMLKSVEDL